ncbi:hypothetical protein M0G43_00060 [Subsaxibacter sp. CAU 1640]|uniref:hypothetical protein n=1 Tax=Subsaxibacter sp. CAU 1640 TaxID=2933271 RepID=UPI00200650E2|nr:hypothetical protein [Subsaxibacter sp. CAU 1640]MCK7588956.1 hypothetical protein [Subsaxibacter sp. CAU 1640]
MKILKKLLTICLLIISLSCSNDDDGSSGNTQLYVPTQISTVQTGSTNVTDMNIEYNSSNRISQFSFVNGSQTNSYDITYTADGIISSIINTRPDTSTLEYAFEYSNGKVSQVTLINSSSSIPLTVVYNEFANTYSVPSGLGDLLFKYDASGNIVDISATTGNFLFSYSSSEGVFKNIPDNFPLMLVISLGSSSSNIFNTLLFSTKQLTGITFFGNNVNVESTRNQNNEIEMVKLIDATTFDIQSTSTITYELR